MGVSQPSRSDVGDPTHTVPRALTVPREATEAAVAQADPAATGRPRGWRDWRNLATRGRAGLSGLAERLGPAWEAVQPALGRVRAVLACVSVLGWTVLAGVVLSGLLGPGLGWIEFSYLALALFLLFGLACLFTIGRTQLEVRLDVAPQRVKVGEASAARLHVTNTAGALLLPIGVECPVGRATARFALPTLAAGASHEDVMVVPTQRRGVVVLGPVTTQRGDPFGMVRRELSWTDPIEMFVHPRTAPLEPLGSGLLRDLEGQTTNDTSMSDLAFHTLREYSPGDDRRYIHWRSSAKVSAASGGGRFLVKQFLDTRRSHIAVVVDVEPTSYRTDEEFELALSVGASVATRALLDEMELTVVCGRHAIATPIPYLAMDTFSRAEFDDVPLPVATGRLTLLAPDASVAVLVTGSLAEFADFQRARAYLPQEVNTVGIVADEGADLGLRETAGLTVLTVGELNGLPRLLGGGLQ